MTTPAYTGPLPTDWKIAQAVIQVSRLTLLYGPPGTGKTTAANKLLPTAKTDVINVTLTEETSAAELRGFFVPSGSEFEWMDGPAIAAWRTGARLVLNEIDHASGDCLTFLLGLLDDMEVAGMTLPNKQREMVRPDKGFSCVATMNGIPNDLPPALKDRFAVRVEITNPHPAVVEALPDTLREVAKRHITHSNPEQRFGIRSFKELARLQPAVGDEVAFGAVFGPRAKDMLSALKIAK